MFHLHWSLILPTHIIWFSPSVPLLLAAAHRSLFLVMQNKPIYRNVTVSRWMIATQHLIYGYVLLCACVLDILYFWKISPVSCSYISALLYIKSCSFLHLHIIMDGLKKRYVEGYSSPLSYSAQISLPVFISFSCAGAIIEKSFEIAACLLSQSIYELSLLLLD